MVDLARQNDCKVFLSVTNLGEGPNTTFLSSFTAQKNSIPAIIDAAKLRDADGITLNFEVVPGNLSHNYTLYVIGLSNALKAEGMKLNMTIPSKDLRDAYAVEELINHVDQFIIMGYKNNEVVLPFEYASLSTKDHRYYAFKKKGGKLGIMDSGERINVEPVYDNILLRNDSIS